MFHPIDGLLFMSLAGLGSGALHAVSGPDHLLSLVPLSLRRQTGAWRLGLLWGVGHGLGTVVAAGVLFAAVSVLHLEALSHWAERVAALALIVTGILGARRHQHPSRAATRSEERGATLVGMVHGLTGAAALLLILPVAISGTATDRLLYLGGFSIGSTLAMAVLTCGLSSVSRLRRFPRNLGTQLPRLATALSVTVGATWMVTTF